MFALVDGGKAPQPQRAALPLSLSPVSSAVADKQILLRAASLLAYIELSVGMFAVSSLTNSQRHAPTGLRLRVKGLSVCENRRFLSQHTRQRYLQSMESQVCHPAGVQVLRGHRETLMTGEETPF